MPLFPHRQGIKPPDFPINRATHQTKHAPKDPAAEARRVVMSSPRSPPHTTQEPPRKGTGRAQRRGNHPSTPRIEPPTGAGERPRAHALHERGQLCESHSSRTPTRPRPTPCKAHTSPTRPQGSHQQPRRGDRRRDAWKGAQGRERARRLRPHIILSMENRTQHRPSNDGRNAPTMQGTYPSPQAQQPQQTTKAAGSPQTTRDGIY